MLQLILKAYVVVLCVYIYVYDTTQEVFKKKIQCENNADILEYKQSDP